MHALEDASVCVCVLAKKLYVCIGAEYVQCMQVEKKTDCHNTYVIYRHERTYTCIRTDCWMRGVLSLSRRTNDKH